MKTTKRKASRSIDPPDLPRTTSLEALNIDRFVTDSYEMAMIEGAVLKDSSASGFQFDCCVLSRIELDRSMLSNLMMIDVRVEKSSVANGNWAKLSLRCIEIVSSQLTGLTEFRESIIERATFTGCDLRNADLAHSKLTDIDLRESKIEGLLLGATQLGSLTVDPSQAMIILQMLGAKVG
jgi:uncharacterized protein YjbI with pentapeptide repeats